jgi:two-component system CheB/CheR fusion protein
MDVIADALRDVDGRPDGVVGILVGVDELVEARNQIRQDAERLRAVLDGLLDPHAVLAPVRDETGRIVDLRCADINDAGVACLRATRDQITGARISVVLPSVAPSGLLALFITTIETGEPLVLDEVQYPALDPTGTDRRVKVRAVPVADALSVMWRDVTPMREEEELARQTAIDASTGLLNRVHFRRSLEREVDQCRQTGTPLTLVWIDSDRFKEVNDQYGHAVGDAMLRATAEGLTSVVRPTDIVGRVGGDEFGVMLTGYADANDRDAAVDRMLAAIRRPTPVGPADVVMTASIGVAVHPEDGATADALMQAADAAMHAAKKLGGDTFEYFREELTRAADQRRRRRSEIDRAIAGREFVLHYQPVNDARTGRLWGVEALVRWNRDGRVVSAGEFIDFCEASGQIKALAPLTLSLFRTDLEVLREAGVEVGRACINLSPSQLEDQAFTDLMGWWPPPTGLQGVVVEVTEAAFLPRHGHAIEALRRLAGLGAELSVDDFGSGYSNFSLLKSLSPAFIKLDRSFLADLQAGGRGGQLLAAAIHMAHALDSFVIVEGIESAEQLARVTELGADLVQGDFIAEPMPRDALVSWIMQSTSDGSLEA